MHILQICCRWTHIGWLDFELIVRGRSIRPVLLLTSILMNGMDTDRRLRWLTLLALVEGYTSSNPLVH
jgi:hypothetical protein